MDEKLKVGKDFDGGEEWRRVKGNHLLTLTSGRQFIPDIPGRDFVTTSDEALELRERPRSVCVLGDGYTALEFACIFNGLGSKTHIVQNQPKVLRGFDEEARVQMAVKGVKFHTESSAVEIERETDGGLLLLTDKGERIAVETVVYVTGRKLTHTITSDRLGSSVPSMWRVGNGNDATSLLPVPWMESIGFMKVAFKRDITSQNRRYVPIGSAGVPELQQDARPSTKSSSSQRGGLGDREFMQVLSDLKSDVVIGKHTFNEGRGGDLIEVLTSQSIVEAFGRLRAQLQHLKTPCPLLACLISGEAEQFCHDYGLGEYQMDVGYDQVLKRIIKRLSETPGRIEYSVLSAVGRILGLDMGQGAAGRSDDDDDDAHAMVTVDDDANLSLRGMDGSLCESSAPAADNSFQPRTRSSQLAESTECQGLMMDQSQFRLFCPFSHQLMRCPVELKETGITFERTVIEEWLHAHSTCPLTGKSLRSKELVDNEAIRKLSEEYRLQSRSTSTSSMGGTLSGARKVADSGLCSDATSAASSKSSFETGGNTKGGRGPRPSPLAIPTAAGRDGPVALCLSPSLRASGSMPCLTCSSGGGGGLSSPSVASSPTGSTSGHDNPINYSECKARIQKLVTDLTASMDAERQRIVAGEVRRLAAENWETRACLYYGKVVPELMTVLRKSQEPEVQLAALRALFNMLMDTMTKEALVNLGGVQMLLKLASRSNRLDVREEAAGCLYSLSVLELEELLTALRPALTPLIDIAKVGSPKGRDDAIKALWNLAASRANKQVIANDNCIPFLLQLLTDRSSPLDRRMLKVVASLLDRVAKCREGQWAIANAAGIPKMAALISKADLPDQVKEYVVGVLDSLWVEHDSAILNVVDTNALKYIIDTGADRARKKAKALLEKMEKQQLSLLKQIHVAEWERQQRWQWEQGQRDQQAVTLLQGGPSSADGYGNSSFLVATSETDSGFGRLRTPTAGAHHKSLSRSTLQRFCIDKSYSNKY